jgi:hypothetical protein
VVPEDHLDDGSEVWEPPGQSTKGRRFGAFEAGVTFDRLVKGKVVGEGSFGTVRPFARFYPTIKSSTTSSSTTTTTTTTNQQSTITTTHHHHHHQSTITTTNHHHNSYHNHHHQSPAPLHYHHRHHRHPT